ncbi:MAG: type II toxin-antitoxin system RelE/ParE family toxin [Bacteroidales bacterium]|nr:type II toxin-antitoxin system RelE/ParE family toxin [Bacteroidales bacterium]
MKLKITKAFKGKLNLQVDYIAQDKPAAAQKFKDDILVQIVKLINMPYSNRRSMFFSDDNIRDLVFKGYVIVYKIDENEDVLTVFGFNKYKLNPF